MTTDADIERIAKLIDPDNTFLNECDEMMKRRFGSEYEELKKEKENE